MIQRVQERKEILDMDKKSGKPNNGQNVPKSPERYRNKNSKPVPKRPPNPSIDPKKMIHRNGEVDVF